MHKIYRINSGIEFQVGVKTKIFLILIGIMIGALILFIDPILEVIIGGF